MEYLVRTPCAASQCKCATERNNVGGEKERGGRLRARARSEKEREKVGQSEREGTGGGGKKGNMNHKREHTLWGGCG